MSGRCALAVSLGDPCGVGPEVVAAALEDPRVTARIAPIVFGDRGALAAAAELRRVPLRCAVREVTHLPRAERLPGKPQGDGARAGAAALAYVDAAIDSVLSGEAQALCTAPLSKHRVSLSAPGFAGHTEHLAQRFGAEVAMMLAGPRLRVALATNHLALSEVPGRLTAARLTFVVRLCSRELSLRFGVARPRIAVCGLNPHAGDGGIFGDEEARLVSPAIADARKDGIDAQGPFAADGLFPRAVAGAFDAVVALYHDQGLIPAKLLDFRETVNVTLGLPHPRTSPDHGTADDIAGTGTADAEPMIQALLLAARLAGATG
ncbi:MAG TPA: 4-hydroxythreonine-4-phosphate dehydrogenase PdxA [Myxococcales bacterium]|nr:4-hydroxythreonine-4-phosphate dehydrogenase PdxA [Myxococcales bacterium]